MKAGRGQGGGPVLPSLQNDNFILPTNRYMQAKVGEKIPGNQDNLASILVCMWQSNKEQALLLRQPNSPLVNTGIPIRVIKALRTREGRFIDPEAIVTERWVAETTLNVQDTIDLKEHVEMPSCEKWHELLSEKEQDNYGKTTAAERDTVKLSEGHLDSQLSNRRLGKSKAASTCRVERNFQESDV